MLAKIVGAIMLVLGIALALKSVGGVVAGVFGFIVLLAAVALVVGLIYMAWRLINRSGALGKVIGAFMLVGGIALAVPTGGLLVAGTLGAIGLAVKVIATTVMIYFGWRWLKHGAFTAPSAGELRRYRV